MFITRAAVFIAGCLVAATSATPTSPGTSPAKRQALAQVITKCTKANNVALTFDDGPYVYLYDIVNALDAAGAVGTFFFNGNNYGCIYDDANIARVKFAYNHGHMVASHTWAHLDLSQQSWDKIHDEMWKVEQALQRITGAYPAFMRPPYGNYNDLVRQASAIRGQKLVIWDFDSGDSTGSTVQQSKNAYTSKITQHPSTILALNHETYETTAHQVLPFAIQKLQAAGYQLVSVADCLGLPRYQSVGSPQVKDSTWHC